MTTNGGILQDLSINHDLITTKFSCSIQSRNTVSITRDDSSLLSYRKSYIAWDKLERANKPDNYTEKTKYLSKNAKALLSVVYQKLKKQHLLLLNHKYISTITNSGRRQNQNVVKELSELLDISYHRSTEDHKGKKYEYVYKFTLKSETKNPSKKCVIRKKISSSNTSSTYIDKNKIINNRSNKSNFCKFNSGSNNTDQLKDSEVSKNTEITKNGFLGSGKHLNEMLEYLTDDICNILRTRSGRNFTDRAIKEIAKAVSRSKQGSKAFFYHIKGFIAYLSKILRFEKRDTIKISSINYYIASNLTEKEKIIQKQEKYLSEIEYSQQVSPEWHLKKKLAAVLRRDIAYKILSNYHKSEKTGNIFKIYLTDQVAIGEMDKQIILNQVKATQERVGENGNIESIEEIEFIFTKKTKQRSEKGESEKLADITKKEEIKKLPIWLQIRKYFMDYCFDIEEGIGRDKSWLSKLKADENDRNKTLILTSENNFIRDWINSNYLFKLESISRDLGYNLSLSK